MSRSTIDLALAPSSRCPHCGRTTKTVQGVCADCWGSKGGRQFWMRRYQGSNALVRKFLSVSGVWIIVFGALLASVPALLIAIAWISG